MSLKPFATTETVQLVQGAAGISLVSFNEHNTLRHRARDQWTGMRKMAFRIEGGGALSGAVTTKSSIQPTQEVMHWVTTPSWIFRH